MKKPSLSIISSTLQISILAITVSFLTACNKENTVEVVEPKKETVKPKKEDISSISIGSCFNDKGELTGEQEISSLAIHDCKEQHDNEIYYTFALPEGEFPTNNKNLYDKCSDEFDKFVEIAYEDSKYDFDIILPTKSSWLKGDKEVLCVVYDGEYAKLSNSVKGLKK